MKNYSKVVLGLIVVAVVNLIVMLAMYPGLPDQVPVHFNYRFEVDAMGSPLMLLVVPAIVVAFSVSILIEQRIRGKDYANNKPLTIFAVIFVALFIVLGWLLYAMMGSGAQMGEVAKAPIDLVLGLGMSVLFIVLGNYLPTIQPNRTFGIRMPSTLNNEECWRKVHRFGGPAFVIGGLFSAVFVLVGHFNGLMWMAFVGLMLGIFIPMLAILVYLQRVKREIKARD